MGHTRREKKQQAKRMATFPARGDPFTKTTGSSFYSSEKKDRMLEKIRVDRERAHSLKVNEAVLVTKYASKFRINAKGLRK